MDQMAAASSHFELEYPAPEGEKEQYDIEYDGFFTIKNRQGFKFYTVDIKNTDISRLKKIVGACEKVENACWTAQENFYSYFNERDMITYIVKDGKVVGFQLLSHWVIDRYVVFGLDETMVLKEYRGNRLGLTLCVLSARSIFTIFSKKKKAKFVFLSITPNPRVMIGFYKYKTLFKIMQNSFKPSESLMMIHDKLLFRKKATLVNRDYPFFFKNMFPGSLGSFEMNDFPKPIRKMVPPEISFFERGDAFIFMAIFSKLTCWVPLTVMMLLRFGRKCFFNENLGFFRKNKKIKLSIQ
ncbi:MAG: hypothetical protein KJ737_06175 [Proteobacteria bacterium]|nr:hypothetical protein [Pseudomonadota bacterium]